MDNEASNVAAICEYIPQIFRQFHETRSERALQEQILIARNGFGTLLQKFLKSDKPILVITGYLAIGKTYLLNHYHRRISLNEADKLSILLDAARLNPDLSVEEHINQLIDFYLDTSKIKHPEFKQLFQELVYQCANISQFVVLIDALNETQLPAILANSIFDLAQKFAVTKRVKIVVTLTPRIWHELKSGSRLPLGYVFHEQMVEFETLNYVEDGSYLLDRFSADELKQAFKIYSTYFGIQKADFGAFNLSMRELLREPYLLRFLCIRYAGMEIPRDFQSIQLFEALLQDASTAVVGIEGFRFLLKYVVPLFFRW